MGSSVADYVKALNSDYLLPWIGKYGTDWSNDILLRTEYIGESWGRLEIRLGVAESDLMKPLAMM